MQSKFKLGATPVAIGILVLAALTGVIYNGCNARTKAGTVVAKVNGEAIYASDVESGITLDSFDATAETMKSDKLNRLINQMAIRQFLAEHRIKVPKSQIDKEIKKLEDNPPSMGCACCTYPTLNAFLEASGYTLDDLRAEISNNLGISEYAKKSWRESHASNDDILREIGEEGKMIRKRYVKGWQIFFNTFQQAGISEQTRTQKSELAQKAWQKLQAGQPFDAVAKSMSEDMTSKKKGGELGPIEKSTYGEEFEAMLGKISPGSVSKPFESSWGFHIIKWEPMTDDDIVKFCESYLVDKETKKLYSEITQNAKIERLNSDNQ